MKLKTKLSKLRHDGHITDAEYAVIINVLNKFSTQPPKTKPCEDCISREEAIKEFQIYREYSSNRSNSGWVDRIEAVLKDLPPVTPLPKIGKWLAKSFHEVYCDNCGFDFDIMTNEFMDKMKYCPNCGAKMTESEG